MIGSFQGNAYFNRGEYSNAIRCYTAAMLEDPSNPIYPNNRAMTYLKMERYVVRSYGPDRLSHFGPSIP